MTQFPYILCKIRDRNGDLSKRWYVEYFVWDVKSNDLKRQQKWISSITYKSKAERLRQARYLKKIIDKALSEGKVKQAKEDDQVRIKRKKKEVSPYSGIEEALKYAYQVKCSGNAVRTGQQYKTIYDRLLAFFQEKQINLLMHVEKSHGYEFLDHTVQKYNLCNTSRNNTLRDSRSFFKVFQDRDIHNINPFEGIKRLKEHKKMHTAYLDAQADKIKEHLKEKDHQLFLFCSFIYYSFIRPKELRFLQVKHIEASKIIIPATLQHRGKTILVSKNRRSEYVVIPTGLRQLIDERGISQADPEHFIFSKAGCPGAHHVSANYFNIRYREIMRELKIPAEHTAYSWKHTGVIKLYKQIKDVIKIQQQCRHKDLQTTVDYLRDLGLFDNREVELQFPEF